MASVSIPLEWGEESLRPPAFVNGHVRLESAGGFGPGGGGGGGGQEGERILLIGVCTVCIGKYSMCVVCIQYVWYYCSTCDSGACKKRDVETASPLQGEVVAYV